MLYFPKLNFFSLYFFLFFVFYLFSLNFWGGLFFLNFNNFYYLLFLMSFLIFLFVFSSELSFVLVFLSFSLIILSFLFFFSSNLFLLYIYFELSIFPIVLMILGFGFQIEKISSCYYLFFYSAFCSLPFLLVLFSLMNIIFFINFFIILSWEFSLIVFLLFLMKFPLYFLHIWLPKAHVEAPTSASMLLAGLLLKLGTGGFFRVLSLFKFNFEYILVFVSFIGFLLSCFMCVFQSDLKALSAFSSISHMMFLLFLFLSLSIFGKLSSFSIMFLHGFISTLMFFFVGEYYHYSGTRLIYFFGGFSKISLLFLVSFSLVWLFNAGVPFSISFFSEYIGIMMFFNITMFIFFIFFFYFFLSFYYSLYVLVSSFISKNFVKVFNLNLMFSVLLLFWSINIFCFNLFF